MAKVWQIAGGENGRSFFDIFLKHDVMFMGPGWPGPFDEIGYRKHDIPNSKISQLKRFCDVANDGDFVILRFGNQAKAVGVIKSSCDHSEIFGDVYGWGLQHCRRVEWIDNSGQEIQKLLKGKPLFGSHRNKTFSGTQEFHPISSLFDNRQDRELKALPAKPSDRLSFEEVGDKLFTEGLPSEAVEKVIVALKKQTRMLQWYRQHGNDSGGRPKEHEVVAHMILPLLLALGWSEQLLAIEWHKVDLAIFSGTPTTKDNCFLLCEAKGWGRGLQNAFLQAKDYITKHEITNCKKILLTDGQFFYIHKKINDQWNETPSGYLNVLNIRENYVVPEGASGIATIMELTPLGMQNGQE